MGLSNVVAIAMRVALNILATPGLQYRPGLTGTWSPLLGVFHADATQVVGYDDAHNAIVSTSTAHVKIPDNATQLQVQPTGSEWQVMQADGTVWTVVGQSRHNGQTFYSLVRAVSQSVGMARGEVR